MEENNKTICELRVICREDKETYPFAIKTLSRTLYSTFAEAEAAIPHLVLKYATQKWIKIYRYEIYTIEISREIEVDKITGCSKDVTIYFPNGTRWISRDEKGIIQAAKIYEFVSGEEPDQRCVDLCIIDNDMLQDIRNEKLSCSFLAMNRDFAWGTSAYSDVMPCSLPISDAYAEALRSMEERHFAVERDELLPIRGVPYPVVSKFNEDMSDYLFIPAAFSGYQYDIFFDCNAAYRKNMHPLWFYVAYPANDKKILLPIAVSSEIVIMWDEYMHLDESLNTPESIYDFMTFNLRNIMYLADRNYSPEYFLWSMIKMDTVNKLMSVEINENSIKQ